MNKNIPAVLKDYVLPFNWDVVKIWLLDCPVKIMKVEQFEYLLDLPLWSSKPSSGMLFDIKPIDVINNPLFNAHQYQRMIKSDYLYPIEFLELNDKLWLLDGSHRMAKLKSHKIKDVSVRIHQKNIIERIKSCK